MDDTGYKTQNEDKIKKNNTPKTKNMRNTNPLIYWG